MTTDTFTYARTLALSPARLWPLLTNAQMRAKWGLPDDSLTLESVSSNVQVGGTDHHRAGPAEAPEFEQFTRWYHLAEPSNLVYTETIVAGGMALGASLVTMTASAQNGGTALTVTVAVSSFVGPDMIAEFQSGWDGSMANLDRLTAIH